MPTLARTTPHPDCGAISLACGSNASRAPKRTCGQATRCQRFRSVNVTKPVAFHTIRTHDRQKIKLHINKGICSIIPRDLLGHWLSTPLDAQSASQDKAAVHLKRMPSR
eukprot:jgi/Ulvmu1/4666/UM002_0397.1